MQIKTVFIFGNPDLKDDSLPIKLVSQLKKKFPDISFEIKDPNEEWNVPEKLVVIDTVIGLEEITVFDDLDKFVSAPRLTMHDFDALANLRYMKKLGKLKKIKIIGVPPDIGEEKALDYITEILRLQK